MLVMFGVWTLLGKQNPEENAKEENNINKPNQSCKSSHNEQKRGN
jgi:hypothetical protein